VPTHPAFIVDATTNTEHAAESSQICKAVRGLGNGETTED
jgi:hypothetical protein